MFVRSWKEMVKELLKHGADIEATNHDGRGSPHRSPDVFSVGWFSDGPAQRKMDPLSKRHVDSATCVSVQKKRNVSDL